MPRIGQRRIPENVQGGGMGGRAYLLRDEFSGDLAAGAVNGAPAVPGPGTRSEDGDAVNSISGGAYVWAQWTTTKNALRYADIALVRKLGQVVLVKARITSGAATQFYFGLSTSAAAPTPTAGAGEVQVRCQGPGSAMRFILNGLYNINDSDTWPNNANYQQFAIVLRATGALLFRKFDTDTQWLLSSIWTPSGANSPLYFYWSNFTATANDSDGALDFVRFPQSPYIFTPLAYAAFGGADGPLGNTDVLGPDLQISPVLAWVNQVGTWAIATNKATATALAGGLAIATVPTASADAHIRIALTRAGGSVGGIARYQDSSNYLRFSHDGVNALCEQVVAGTPTTLRTGAATFVADALIYLIVSGTTGWLFYNNVAIGASFTVPASTQKAHGLYTTNVGNTMDGFEVWAYGTGGEHGILAGM